MSRFGSREMHKGDLPTFGRPYFKEHLRDSIDALAFTPLHGECRSLSFGYNAKLSYGIRIPVSPIGKAYPQLSPEVLKSIVGSKLSLEKQQCDHYNVIELSGRSEDLSQMQEIRDEINRLAGLIRETAHF